jgi:hypothetical protein
MDTAVTTAVTLFLAFEKADPKAAADYLREQALWVEQLKIDPSEWGIVSVSDDE